MSVVKRTGFKVSRTLYNASNNSIVKIGLGFLFHTAEAFALCYSVKKVSLARVEGPPRPHIIEFSIKNLLMKAVLKPRDVFIKITLTGKFENSEVRL